MVYPPPNIERAHIRKTAIGRNDSLFRALCSLVGKLGNDYVLQSELAAIVDIENQVFEPHGLPPLGRAEVQGIVRSVYKRHQRKLASGDQQRTFAFILRDSFGA